MARIRNIKPGFFRDETLQDLQAEHSELHPMLVFAGLWTVADKNGVFEWLPRTLKLDILPFLSYDLVASLALLERFSLISQFSHDGRAYGFVANFSEHQRISGKELATPSKYPAPPEQGSTRQVSEKQPDAQEGDGVQGEEGKGEGNIPPDLHANQYATRLLQEIGFPEARANIIAVASAIESEVKLGKSKPAAYEYVLACTKDLRDEGIPITTFTFTEAKYRPENRRNGNGTKQHHPTVERVSANRGVLADLARECVAERVGPDSHKRESGDRTTNRKRISASAG